MAALDDYLAQLGLSPLFQNTGGGPSGGGINALAAALADVHGNNAFDTARMQTALGSQAQALGAPLPTMAPVSQSPQDSPRAMLAQALQQVPQISPTYSGPTHNPFGTLGQGIAEGLGGALEAYNKKQDFANTAAAAAGAGPSDWSVGPSASSGGGAGSAGSVAGLSPISPAASKVPTLASGSIPGVVHSTLTDAGLTPIAAAGVLGNIKQESSFNPGAAGDSGSAHGLFQWRGDRYTGLQNFASQNGLNPFDPGTQTKFALKEAADRTAPDGTPLIDAMNAAGTPTEAAMLWGKRFEQPRYVEPIRGQYAEQFYRNMPSGAQVAGPGASTAPLRHELLHDVDCL